MNNPLEAVTQAVNSLVTALKLPDESAKANEVLGEMSFPQFSRLLPYRDYNQESGLFMNDTTMGFMLEAIPINGANESIVEALDHMLRTKLPRGIPLCIHLMSSQLVGDRIEYGLREFSWSGEQAERFNAITLGMDELIAKAWRFVRERFRSYQTELKSRGIKRARARRDANRERQDIVTLVKRQLTREISEGRFTVNREAVKREVERRVKERMILSRNRNYSRLATASP
nr:TraC family protein [Escherichia coli]